MTDKKMDIIPFDFKILKILFPVTAFTRPIPSVSRRRAPIIDGVRPFLAKLQISATTCSGVFLTQSGAVLL